MKKTLLVALALLLIPIGSAQARVFWAYSKDKAEAYQKAQENCARASYHKERCRFLEERYHPPSTHSLPWEIRFTDDK